MSTNDDSRRPSVRLMGATGAAIALVVAALAAQSSVSSDQQAATTLAPPASSSPTSLTTTPDTGPTVSAPATTTTPPPSTAAVADTSAANDGGADLSACPDEPRAAVVDKTAQRFWLCEDGESITAALRMTTGSEGYGLPPIGRHEVFSRDEVATGIGGEQLNLFVSFYMTPRDNRIGFHEVVNQDPATVGDLDMRGQSSGCLRVSAADSRTVWNHLQIGDPVIVISA